MNVQVQTNAMFLQLFFGKSKLIPAKILTFLISGPQTETPNNAVGLDFLKCGQIFSFLQNVNLYRKCA